MPMEQFFTRMVMYKSLTIASIIFASTACAAEPRCQTQIQGEHTAKICIFETPFRHDYYALLVDDMQLFALPDDYVENVSLTHTIPEDAAIEFPLSKQGTPTVTISGGCMPISQKKESDGKMIGFEVGRRCSFMWGSVPIVKDMRFIFD
jgi:hypothetical protein